MYAHYWRTILINPFFLSFPPPPLPPLPPMRSLVPKLHNRRFISQASRTRHLEHVSRFAQNGRSPRLANKVLVIYASYDPGHRGRGKIRAHPSHSTTLPTSANSPMCKWKPTML